MYAGQQTSLKKKKKKPIDINAMTKQERAAELAPTR